MKNLLLRTVATLGALPLLAGKAMAKGINFNSSFSIQGLATQTDVATAIMKVITDILNFILVVAVLYVIIAGIRLIVSGGDDGAKDKAKQTIIYVIAGIIVVLLARVIVVAVNDAFGV